MSHENKKNVTYFLTKKRKCHRRMAQPWAFLGFVTYVTYFFQTIIDITFEKQEKKYTQKYTQKMHKNKCHYIYIIRSENLI